MNDDLTSPVAALLKPEEISPQEEKPLSAGRTSAALSSSVPNKAAAVAELASPSQAGAAARKEEVAPWSVETVIHFPFDRATPESAGMKLLVSTMACLLTHLEIGVAIEGHTCRIGNETYNERLGWHRAQAIRKFLVKAGIAPERITQVRTFGERRPVCLEGSEQCRRRNRRVVLRLVKT